MLNSESEEEDVIRSRLRTLQGRRETRGSLCSATLAWKRELEKEEKDLSSFSSIMKVVVQILCFFLLITLYKCAVITGVSCFWFCSLKLCLFNSNQWLMTIRILISPMTMCCELVSYLQWRWVMISACMRQQNKQPDRQVGNRSLLKWTVHFKSYTLFVKIVQDLQQSTSAGLTADVEKVFLQSELFLKNSEVGHVFLIWRSKCYSYMKYGIYSNISHG